ncbi:hypothetical protein [Algibacter pectinivorans]|uniref:Uncharacterized protein n=1 Tax=Algibacter pectinivorans TaxID=870482 RepID=A0A1I1RMA7_9FLAO|nr:hypothetical protein [Algibacter pectinivorans]SFD35471.1 hypothetical protein SAMN04487987_110108 [Algibacter pectinivorans]
MIEGIYLKNKDLKKNYNILFENQNVFENTISLKVINDIEVKDISFEIKFTKKIIAYRSHEYKWKKINRKKNHILNQHCPKIIVFEDYTYMLSSKNIGAWEIQNPNQILWILKSSELHPIFSYGKGNYRNFVDYFKLENYKLKLLFSKKPVPEFSRSKIPFTPIICFTDHCDFDTNESLEKQLTFFSQNNVKVSKGFFLNHFSKRENNSSYENDKSLLLKFDKSGHELFYHALTQSIRKNKTAINEFVNFNPPKEFLVSTYVDHGYQPYNYTLKNHSELGEKEWTKIISEKGIKNLWTYLDSGTSQKGIINQLNPYSFTPKRLIKNHIFRPIFIFRTLLFFNSTEELLLKYKLSASHFKKILLGKEIKLVPLFLTTVYKCLFYCISTILIKKKRNKVFKYSKYTPFIFQHKIKGITFNFFQTVEVTNFEKTFSKKNIELLIEESGAIIAHCYFSSPLTTQKGKLFHGDTISKINEENFALLKEKLQKNKIWNPTISELINFTTETSKLEYHTIEDEIKVKATTIPTRYIKYV